MPFSLGSLNTFNVIGFVLSVAGFGGLIWYFMRRSDQKAAKELAQQQVALEENAAVRRRRNRHMWNYPESAPLAGRFNESNQGDGAIGQGETDSVIAVADLALRTGHVLVEAVRTSQGTSTGDACIPADQVGVDETGEPLPTPREALVCRSEASVASIEVAGNDRPSEEAASSDEPD